MTNLKKELKENAESAIRLCLEDRPGCEIYRPIVIEPQTILSLIERLECLEEGMKRIAERRPQKEDCSCHVLIAREYLEKYSIPEESIQPASQN